MVRAIAASLMTRLGFDVAEVEHGADALVQCAQTMPKLILVDWNMPQMDGIMFIRALRALRDVPQPFILLMSTETRLNAIRMALRAGADSYLMKPFDQTRLEHRLRRFGLTGAFA
jgi:two-component system, chemotaxis family, chemotaxis protein CheY